MLSSSLTHRFFPIVLLPLDARPVCYQTPQLLASVLGASLYLPPVELFGVLKQPANIAALKDWLDETLMMLRKTDCTPHVIANAQLLLHGGLIPSRVDTQPQATLLQELDEEWFALMHSYEVCPDVFSAILRIPAYNNAEEEPDYWAVCGRAIYDASAAVHRALVSATNTNNNTDHAKTLTLYPYVASLPTPEGVPQQVWQQVLERRACYHGVHRFLLEEQERGALATLVFAQDDTGEYGLNVAEANELRAWGASTNDCWVQTGADEVAHTLMVRHWLQSSALVPRVWVGYSHTTGAACLAKFDGCPLETVVLQRLLACGAEQVSSPQEADVWLLVHSPEKTMGDHCSVQPSDGQDALAHAWVMQQLATATQQGKGVILADVAYANGADTTLLEQLLRSKSATASAVASGIHALWGYGAWNTPGNALGSALAMGLTVWLAKQLGTFCEASHQQLLALRLLDDGAYQSVVRQQVRASVGAWVVPTPSEAEALLQALMHPWQQRVQACLPQSRTTDWGVYFPCHRTFEVGFSLNLM
jgi:hypothetical protein